MELDWVQVLITVPAVLTIIWAVASFTLDRKSKQREERKRLSALYVNPFLLACEELQSRFYNILRDHDQQTVWAKDSGDTSQAEETLYLIAQYFGWERHIFRYGPYAQNTEVFQRTEAIRAAFATDRVGVPEGIRRGREPFCFHRYQQKALSQLILQSSEGPAGLEAETIPYLDFKQSHDELEHSLPSVSGTLEVLRSSDFPQNLHPLVHGRLAEVQNHLVMLLAYLEEQEKFTLFLGERKKAKRHDNWIAWAERRGWGTLLGDQDQ